RIHSRYKRPLPSDVKVGTHLRSALDGSSDPLSAVGCQHAAARCTVTRQASSGAARMAKARKAKGKPRYGWLNRAGDWCVEPKFDEVTTTRSGPMPVRVGKQWGVVDRDGTLLAEPQFAEVGTFGDAPIAPAQCAD